MDYPVGWSMQTRRKQPSLYDEYLSQGRSNVPSSPRLEQHYAQSSPTFPSNASHGFSSRMGSPDPIREENSPSLTSGAPNPSSAASTSGTPRPGDQMPPVTSASDLNPIASTSSVSSLRRKAPPPIATGSDGGTPPAGHTPWYSPSSASTLGHEAAKKAPTSLRTYNHPESPAASGSSATSPISATFAGAFAERYDEAKRKFGSMSSAEALAQQAATGLQSLPKAATPPTSSLPALPLSATQPTIAYPEFQQRPAFGPSSPQPASAVMTPRMATPGFIRPQSSRSDATSISDPLPTANTRRVLHLMKTLCGRMSGGLNFRRDVSHSWTSAYCFIEELDGSLMSESVSDTQHASKYLISDLRGCQVTCHFDIGTEAPYLQVSVPTSDKQVHLKMPSQADLESWYAALLCWHPIRRRGMHNKLPKPQPPTLVPRPTDRSRQDSDPSISREAPIVRIGRMVYWDSHVSFGNTLPMSAATFPARRIYNQVAKSHGARRWRRVSCTLRENGELKFFTEADRQDVAVVQLAQLSRDAIVRLDPSVMDSNHCIAILPQYIVPGTAMQTAPTGPIYLGLESRMIWEVWFVLLSAFTVPTMYGPSAEQIEKQQQLSPVSSGAKNLHMFRMSQNLIIKVNDARIQKLAIPDLPSSQSGAGPATTAKSPNMTPGPDKPCGCYVDISVDGQIRGKTALKDETTNPSWRQEYELTDIAADLSSACITLKYRPPDSYASHGAKQGMPYYHDAYGQLLYPHMTNADTGFVGVFRDQVIGRVDLSGADLMTRKDSEHWWPVLNDQNQKVAEISLRLRADDSITLMREEYDAFSQMLHKFETGLTVQLSHHIPMELKRLSENLVNIFQASGRIMDWLMSLVEEEVDGVTKDSFLSKSRYGQDSRGSTGSDPDRLHNRELAVRDMNKNATLEANLLFRGNTLLTKALDVHMRRIGDDYLASAIGHAIEEINDADIDCEVDPNRVTNQNDVQRNWTRLIATTEKVWEAIASSADSCPAELKMIFRHIRACAEDKYGDFLRTIKYSSVSGFLFLRLFCPAVLNPKLFGLLKFEPPPKSRRTFTLVAKSLQTLANLATFGSKEYWMEPMNAFLTSHRTSFKEFIDKVCFMAVEPAVIPEPQPAHSAPNTIRGRLPQTSKEGLLTLPYLMDESREYGSLAELWLHATNSQMKSSTTRPTEDDKGVQAMSAACKGLRQRAEECLFRAEKARRPGPDLESQWEELVDALQATSTLQSETLSVSSDKHGYDLDSQQSHEIVKGMPGQSLDALRISGTDQLEDQLDFIRATPPLKQLDWTTAPDGGAATAEAATLLADERSPRSAFVLTSPNIAQRSSSPSSPALITFQPPIVPASEAPHVPQPGSGPTSAPSSRPGSSLSMRAASRLTRMRSGPNSDSEENGSGRRTGTSIVRGSSRRRREEKAAAKQQPESSGSFNPPALLRTSSSTGDVIAPLTSKTASLSTRDGKDRESRDSDSQRIRGLVNGFPFGRRRAEKAASAAAAAANGGGLNLPAVYAAAGVTPASASATSPREEKPPGAS